MNKRKPHKRKKSRLRLIWNIEVFFSIWAMILTIFIAIYCVKTYPSLNGLKDKLLAFVSEIAPPEPSPEDESPSVDIVIRYKVDNRSGKVLISENIHRPDSVKYRVSPPPAGDYPVFEDRPAASPIISFDTHHLNRNHGIGATDKALRFPLRLVEIKNTIDIDEVSRAARNSVDIHKTSDAAPRYQALQATDLETYRSFPELSTDAVDRRRCVLTAEWESDMYVWGRYTAMAAISNAVPTPQELVYDKVVPVAALEHARLPEPQITTPPERIAFQSPAISIPDQPAFGARYPDKIVAFTPYAVSHLKASVLKSSIAVIEPITIALPPKQTIFSGNIPVIGFWAHIPEIEHRNMTAFTSLDRIEEIDNHPESPILSPIPILTAKRPEDVSVKSFKYHPAFLSIREIEPHPPSFDIATTVSALIIHSQRDVIAVKEPLSTYRRQIAEVDAELRFVPPNLRPVRKEAALPVSILVNRTHPNFVNTAARRITDFSPEPPFLRHTPSLTQPRPITVAVVPFVESPDRAIDFSPPTDVRTTVIAKPHLSDSLQIIEKDTREIAIGIVKTVQQHFSNQLVSFIDLSPENTEIFQPPEIKSVDQTEFDADITITAASESNTRPPVKLEIFAQNISIHPVQYFPPHRRSYQRYGFSPIAKVAYHPLKTAEPSEKTPHFEIVGHSCNPLEKRVFTDHLQQTYTAFTNHLQQNYTAFTDISTPQISAALAAVYAFPIRTLPIPTTSPEVPTPSVRETTGKELIFSHVERPGTPDNISIPASPLIGPIFTTIDVAPAVIAKSPPEIQAQAPVRSAVSMVIPPRGNAVENLFPGIGNTDTARPEPIYWTAFDKAPEKKHVVSEIEIDPDLLKPAGTETVRIIARPDRQSIEFASKTDNRTEPYVHAAIGIPRDLNHRIQNIPMPREDRRIQSLTHTAIAIQEPTPLRTGLTFGRPQHRLKPHMDCPEPGNVESQTALRFAVRLESTSAPSRHHEIIEQSLIYKVAQVLGFHLIQRHVAASAGTKPHSVDIPRVDKDFAFLPIDKDVSTANLLGAPVISRPEKSPSFALNMQDITLAEPPGSDIQILSVDNVAAENPLYGFPSQTFFSSRLASELTDDIKETHFIVHKPAVIDYLPPKLDCSYKPTGLTGDPVIINIYRTEPPVQTVFLKKPKMIPMPHTVLLKNDNMVFNIEPVLIKHYGKKYKNVKKSYQRVHNLRSNVERIANSYEFLDTNLLLAIIKIETQGRHGLVSHKNAIGLTQIKYEGAFAFLWNAFYQTHITVGGRTIPDFYNDNIRERYARQLGKIKVYLDDAHILVEPDNASKAMETTWNRLKSYLGDDTQERDYFVDVEIAAMYLDHLTNMFQYQNNYTREIKEAVEKTDATKIDELKFNGIVQLLWKEVNKSIPLDKGDKKSVKKHQLDRKKKLLDRLEYIVLMTDDARSWYAAYNVGPSVVLDRIKGGDKIPSGPRKYADIVIKYRHIFNEIFTPPKDMITQVESKRAKSLL